MKASPGKVGRSYPADERFSEQSHNKTTASGASGPVATSEANITEHFGKAGVVAVLLSSIACVLGGLGFAFGLIAMRDTSRVVDIASDASRAAAKAETATARANTAEIYAYQVYTELNRLGYPVRTPAEDHAPQPPNQPKEQ